ncbi:retrovirus-related pol polyprotein from transposon TNT 1-94 [Tanacetum coccineum]
MVTDNLQLTDSTIMPAPRKKLDSEFNEEENKLEMADTQAEIILSQGLPRHIFNILNQTSTAKEIWDNVELLMQGSGRTASTKEVKIYLRIYNHKRHSKPTAVSQKDSSRNRAVYKYLLIHWHYVAHTTSAPALIIKPQLLFHQPTAQFFELDSFDGHYDSIANHLSGFQKQVPPTNNRIRTSSKLKTHAYGFMVMCQFLLNRFKEGPPVNVGNTGTRGKKVICYNCRGEGHVARQCKEPKRKMDSQYFKDKALLMEAKD